MPRQINRQAAVRVCQHVHLLLPIRVVASQAVDEHEGDILLRTFEAPWVPDGTQLLVNQALVVQPERPDVAVAPVCVSCHNEHPDSPKTDFELGDVMGGVVIRIPMED